MYINRDLSHGINHVIKVRDNALNISNKLNITDINVLLKIESAALFHDLWDHKYVCPLSSEYKDVKKKFSNELKLLFFSEHDIKDIEIIINNISLSHEMKLRKNNQEINLKHLQLLRDIVSDADKIEMLGKNGIERIIEFEIHKNHQTKISTLNKTIKDIYDNKLSKLLIDKYIKTEPGIELAKPLIEELNEYIKKLN